MGIYFTIALIYVVFFWALNSYLEKPMVWPKVVLGALLWPVSVALLTTMGLLVAVGLSSETIEVVQKEDD